MICQANTTGDEIRESNAPHLMGRFLFMTNKAFPKAEPDHTPKIMGILNTTPDSFSDGGKFNKLDTALRQVESMVLNGADYIDVGGESTRPGAAKVELAQELERTVPVIEKIKQNFDIRISIDTSKARVMAEAVAAGASLINDVRALQLPGALDVAVQSGVDVCLMHMQGQPDNMQKAPSYQDVLAEIKAFLQSRRDTCIAAGINSEQIYLDPGFGFGKTLEHNYQLLGNLSVFDELNCPLLIGLSRKSMIGNLLNRDVQERLAGSLAGAMMAALQGARIIRVHDVKETVDCLRVIQKTLEVA